MPLVARWALSRLNHTLRRLTAAFTAYDFHEVAEAGRGFFWDEFCGPRGPFVGVFLKVEGGGVLGGLVEKWRDEEPVCI